MRLVFQSAKDQRLFESRLKLTKTYGSEQAAVIMRRLSELGAADNLAIISHLPPARCHLLVGSRSGQFSVSLKGLLRLVFAPAQTPVPRTPEGGIDRVRVTEVLILGVIDYHD